MPFFCFYVLIINILQSVHPPLKNTSFFKGGVHSSLLFDFQYVTPKKEQKCTPPSQNSREKNILNTETRKNTEIIIWQQAALN